MRGCYRKAKSFLTTSVVGREEVTGRCEEHEEGLFIFLRRDGVFVADLPFFTFITVDLFDLVVLDGAPRCVQFAALDQDIAAGFGTGDDYRFRGCFTAMEMARAAFVGEG